MTTDNTSGVLITITVPLELWHEAMGLLHATPHGVLVARSLDRSPRVWSSDETPLESAGEPGLLRGKCLLCGEETGPGVLPNSSCKADHTKA